MNVLFIVPKADGVNNTPEQSRIFPPIGLARMAGIAGNTAQVHIIDERLSEVSQKQRASIVIIFINSYNQCRALLLAKLYRSLGSYVILSGKILSGIKSKALRHAHTLFTGVDPDIMAKFFDDFQHLRTKPVYEDDDVLDNSKGGFHTQGNLVLSF